MDARRSQRVSEALREELGEMIGYELSDPRIGTATVTEVLVSPDGKRAQVRLALEGDAAKQQAALDALEHARGYLRRELGKRLTLFRIPDLHFEADLSPELSSRVDFLLRRIKRGRPRPDEASPESPGE